MSGVITFFGIVRLSRNFVKHKIINSIESPELFAIVLWPEEDSVTAAVDVESFTTEDCTIGCNCTIKAGASRYTGRLAAIGSQQEMNELVELFEDDEWIPFTVTLPHRIFCSTSYRASVAIETTGVFGPRTTEFLKELGHRLRQVSGEANSYAYLTQRPSVAVQRGNAASALGTIKMDSEEEEFLV
eukprot:Em0009g1161a